MWIYDQLKEEHHSGGGFTIVKDYVREARHRMGNDSASDPSLFAAS